MQESNNQPRRNEHVIQVIQEELNVQQELVETGKVHIHKEVKEETISVNIPIFNETYEVERRAGSPDLLDTPPPAIRHEGDKMIIPVLKEVSIVVKKYQIVEEIHLTRKVTETPLTQEVTLRKEQVTINRTETR